MRFASLILLVSCPLILMGQSANQATLTLVEEDGFNQVDIGLDVALIGGSEDQSDLSGTFEVEVNIMPATSTTDMFTILSADVTGSKIGLSASQFFIGSYDFTSTELGFTAATITPPGEVDPTTGEFDASQHEITTTRGILSGVANTFVTEEVKVDFDFHDNPFSGTGVGTGTITVTAGRIEGRLHYFDLSVEFPLSIEQAIEQEDLPVDADVAIAGTIKAVGETFLDLPDYPTWATDLGLASESENDFDLWPNTPNYIFFALGFDRATAPREIFEFGPEGVAMKVGDGLGLGDVEIEWSDDLVNWSLVPQSSMAAGSSQVKFGDPLSDSPTVKMEAARKYLRVVRSIEP